MYQRDHDADTAGLAANEGLGAVERVDSGEDATLRTEGGGIPGVRASLSVSVVLIFSELVDAGGSLDGPGRGALTGSLGSAPFEGYDERKQVSLAVSRPRPATMHHGTLTPCECYGCLSGGIGTAVKRRIFKMPSSRVYTAVQRPRSCNGPLCP